MGDGKDAATHDPYVLPEGLPVPVDDGAADHLPGMRIPDVVLPSSVGDVALADLAAERFVLYVYPQTGPPDKPVPTGWDEVPGARGCTPQSCSFRDHADELAAFGARVAGVGGWAGAIVAGMLDPRDSTAALGFAAAMTDLPGKTTKGGTLYVFALP